MGRIDKKDGTTVPVSIGLRPDDPVFMIPELSPHVDRGLNSRPLGDFIEPEDLDPVVGHIPMDDSGRAVIDQVLAYLAEEYGVTRADLVCQIMIRFTRPRMAYLADNFFDYLVYRELGSDYREPLFRQTLRSTRFVKMRCRVDQGAAG